MMLRTFVTCGLTLLLVVGLSHSGLATMGGITTVGPLFPPGQSTTTTRELVELTQSGELWVAKPQHAMVEMITLYAPGLRQGHLIIRELLTRDGQLTLLLTAPDDVITHVRRTTLYTKGLQDNIVLFENVHGKWKKRLPQPFDIDSSIDGDVSTQTLKAFSVKKIGFYWLLDPKTAQLTNTHVSGPISARTLMGGKLSWGLLPSILGIMLFIVLGYLSQYVHKTAKLREL